MTRALLSLLTLVTVLVLAGCGAVIDNLPKDVPKGYVICSWEANPGFPLVFRLYPGAGERPGDSREGEVPFAEYRTDNGSGRVRFAARPGFHTLVVSSIGDDDTLAPFRRGNDRFGPMPANEQEVLRIEVFDGMKTPVRMTFERQDSWADWEGDLTIEGAYLLIMAAETPSAEPKHQPRRY
jgi:hypothetical protein